MKTHAVRNIANDNDSRDHPKGDASGYRGMLRERELERRLQALEDSQTIEGPAVKSEVKDYEPKWGLVSALFCTFTSILAAAYCAYSGQSITLSVLALIATTWSALWVTYLSSKSGQEVPSISEFSVVLATFAGLGMWILVSRQWGLSLSAADGVAGFAGLTFITAALLQSRLTLLVSVFSGLVWFAIFTAIPPLNTISVWGYPLLATMQLFIAGQNQMKLSSFFALLGAYSWFFWVLNERFLFGDISLLQIAAFCMMIGLTHYRLGKAAGDALWDSANLHVVFGWSLSMIGLIGLQHYWLGASSELWQGSASHPMGTLAWQIIGGASILLIGIAGLIRIAHQQMSSLAVLFSLVVAIAAAALFDQRDAISNFIQTELFIPAKPLLGLVIGAAIFASAIAMCLNGARRQSSLLMLTGLAAIAAELALVLDPKYWTAETGVMFGFAFIGSLLLATLFAADAQQSFA